MESFSNFPIAHLSYESTREICLARMMLLPYFMKLNKTLAGLAGAAALAFVLGGCATPQENGTAIGAGVGALGGAAVGSAVGAPLAGAAIGGVAGGATGYAVGNHEAHERYYDGY
jgi:osmotically inducible lipoprotein OsmB